MLRSWICIDGRRDIWAFINGTMQNRRDTKHLVIVRKYEDGLWYCEFPSEEDAVEVTGNGFQTRSQAMVKGEWGYEQLEMEAV